MVYFKKQISTKLLIHKTSHIIIGSVWEFFIDQSKDKELFNFAWTAVLEKEILWVLICQLHL